MKRLWITFLLLITGVATGAGCGSDENQTNQTQAIGTPVQTFPSCSSYSNPISLRPSSISQRSNRVRPGRRHQLSDLPIGTFQYIGGEYFVRQNDKDGDSAFYIKHRVSQGQLADQVEIICSTPLGKNPNNASFLEETVLTPDLIVTSRRSPGNLIDEIYLRAIRFTLQDLTPLADSWYIGQSRAFRELDHLFNRYGVRYNLIRKDRNEYEIRIQRQGLLEINGISRYYFTPEGV